MQYYILDEISPNLDAPFLDLPPEIDLIESLMGKKPNFDTLPLKIEAEIDEDEEVVYSDILNPGVPLFSQKMKSALDDCGVKNIDYYPVEIIDESTKELLAEYYLGIVKSIVSCLDLKKSEFAEDKMGKSVITKFTVNESKTLGLNLFRFHHIPGLILIDEVPQEKLSMLNFQGISLKPTQEYYRKV